MSTDLPGVTEPHDPALEGLFRALTADGTAGELAARQAALEMYRTSRRRPRRLRLAFSMSTAAAAIVLVGGISAAYAAALPAPVQHIAYRMLGSIGVPDAHRAAPSSGTPRLAATIPPASSARGSAPSRSPGSRVVGSRVAQMPVPDRQAGGRCRLEPGPERGASPYPGGRKRRPVRPAGPGSRPEAGVRVRLYERAAGTSGWRVAASGVTDGRGDVTLTVPGLTSDAVFRLTGPRGAVSASVLVTVIPPVSLDLAPGLLPGRARLTVMAPLADPGDVVVLQELSGGVWHRVAAHVLGPHRRALFSVLIPAEGGAEYRVVLPRTIAHGRSVSSPVRVAGAGASRGR